MLKTLKHVEILKDIIDSISRLNCSKIFNFAFFLIKLTQLQKTVSIGNSLFRCEFRKQKANFKTLIHSRFFNTSLIFVNEESKISFLLGKRIRIKKTPKYKVCWVKEKLNWSKRTDSKKRKNGRKTKGLIQI